MYLINKKSYLYVSGHCVFFRTNIINEGNRENGMVKCNKKRCHICNFIRQGKKFKSNVTGRTYYVNHVFDCVRSEGVVYLITCKKCGLRYVGNTVTSFRLRFNNHKSSMMRYGKGQRGLAGQFLIIPHNKPRP